MQRFSTFPDCSISEINSQEHSNWTTHYNEIIMSHVVTKDHTQILFKEVNSGEMTSSHKKTLYYEIKNGAHFIKYTILQCIQCQFFRKMRCAKKETCANY